MKTAVIPQVRVEPEFRGNLEAVLQEGETISAFVESAVRSAVEFRHMQSRFHARGQAAWERFQATGESSSADDVLSKLQAKLDAKRRQMS
ncbi:MAG: YlcI/YnfO family protein [Ottowia sp.]|uniref:YlcI/YnfO family protein n=1 Tax=Ottowia sp. TaxID=1898956 RepID=UPI0039E6BBDE